MNIIIISVKDVMFLHRFVGWFFYVLAKLLEKLRMNVYEMFKSDSYWDKKLSIIGWP